MSSPASPTSKIIFSSFLMKTFRLLPPTRPLDVSIDLPTSKSISNRALILSALSSSTAPTEGLSDCDDTAVMIAALKSDLSHVDVGAAGTSMRFLTAFLALTPGTHVITGSERMKQRPIRILVDALRQLGADISYVENDGFPPLRIVGGSLHGGTITVPGDISSQYISALMMIGPRLSGGLTIRLTGNVGSRPYINMTLAMMRQCGASADWQDDVITIPESNYSSSISRVEGDWSASSYWYSLVAQHGGSVRLRGLFPTSLQGDSKMREYGSLLGVETVFSDGFAILSRRSDAVLPSSVNLDLADEPDLAQTLVTALCSLRIPFLISGLNSLRIKETDRLQALHDELAKCGFDIKILEDEQSNFSLSWSPADVHSQLSSEPIATYKDHRMAMSFAAITSAVRQIDIADPDVVSKSYPSFWSDLAKAGFSINEL